MTKLEKIFCIVISIGLVIYFFIQIMPVMGR